MPTISEFFGISIMMYFDDHFPPHFHVEYQGQEAEIEIETGHVKEGKLPPKQLKFVEKWRIMHVDELLEAWEQAKNFHLPQPIEPLE